MPNFAILRVQKLKSAKSVQASMRHAYREQQTPNADETLTPQNTLNGPQNVQEGMTAFQKALPDKIRKNAVQCVEYLVTSSSDAFKKNPENQEKYLRDALSWIEKRHGKENVIASLIHRDEKTPHLCAYVVPKDPDTGRLNCRRFLGGAKALNQMQTDFAETVGRPVGLERGIEGSKATHTKLKTYYGALQSGEKEHKHAIIKPEDLQPKVIKKGFLRSTVENEEGIAARLSEKVKAHYEPIRQTATVARTQAKDEKEIKEALTELRRGIGPVMAALKQVPREFRKEIFSACVKLIQETSQKMSRDQSLQYEKEEQMRKEHRRRNRGR